MFWSDFDGVIADSLDQSILSVNKIFHEIGLSCKVNNRTDYNRCWNSEFLASKGFNKLELKKTLSKEVASLSEQYSLNLPLLQVFKSSNAKIGIISSNSINAINKSLGDFQSIFSPIHAGLVDGKRDCLSKNVYPEKDCYLTDTANDVYLCKELGIACYAYYWGGSYHEYDEIMEAKPDALFTSERELLDFIDLTLKKHTRY